MQRYNKSLMDYFNKFWGKEGNKRICLRSQLEF